MFSMSNLGARDMGSKLTEKLDCPGHIPCHSELWSIPHVRGRLVSHLPQGRTVVC